MTRKVKGGCVDLLIMSSVSTLRARASELLPAGVMLPKEAWEPRHRWIVRLLWLHVPVLAVVSVLRGHGLAHTALEVAPLIACALAARSDALGRRSRSCFAGAGLMIASAVLVHLGGGRI